MIIHSQPFEIRNRLADFGLEEDRLIEDVINRGYQAFIGCTANHPPLIPAIWAWGESIRGLREYLIPFGWTSSNDNLFSVAVHPDGKVAIAIATGDAGTGRPEFLPSTKAPKGPKTRDAIGMNRTQLGLFSKNDSIMPKRTTWFLLIRRSGNNVLSELSLPLSMGEDGYIDRWQERIMLRPFPIDGSQKFEIIPPSPQPDITIDIRRKA